MHWLGLGCVMLGSLECVASQTAEVQGIFFSPFFVNVVWLEEVSVCVMVVV
jgi:hypothetical protein